MLMAFSTALQGIRASTARFDASAARVAGAAQPDFTTEMVDQMVAKQGFEANVKVLSAARDMLDFTLERWA